MSYQISVIHRAQSFSKCSKQYSPSSLGHQRKSVKSVLTGLTRYPQETQFLPSSLGHQSKWQCSPSPLGYQRKVGFYRVHSVITGSQWTQCLPSSVGHQRRISFYRAHSVLSVNLVLTEFTRRLKDFHRILCINRAQSVNTGIILNRVYRAGSASKEFIEICISADYCNDLFSKLFEPTG